jgi:hypothetical protein
MYKKFLALEDIFKKHTYRTEWGMPNLRAALFVFSDHGKYNEAIYLAEKMAAEKLLTCNTRLWFYHLPRFSLSEKGYKNSPHPDPNLFTGPWSRAGFEDSYIYHPDKLPT